MIDTHVHLQSELYTGDLDAVLERAARADVNACIAPASNLADARIAVAIAERFSQGPCVVYAAVGIHPTEVNTLTPGSLAELRDLAHHPRVVAIGEIGLDYYWPRQPGRSWPCAEPVEQRRAFEEQLSLAAEMRLPVIIHDRDAHDDTLGILSEWIKDCTFEPGTLHAYAAGTKNLEKALGMGFLIGIDGPVTYGKASDLHDVARQMPLDRLLLETDGPYLPPHPYRGKRNEPSYLPLIASRIAELRGLPPSAIAVAATRNACRLFRIQAAV